MASTVAPHPAVTATDLPWWIWLVLLGAFVAGAAVATIVAVVVLRAQRKVLAGPAPVPGWAPVPPPTYVPGPAQYGPVPGAPAQ